MAEGRCREAAEFRRQRIEKLLTEGLSVMVIAERLGVSPAVVRNVLKKKQQEDTLRPAS